jgi:gas vesicle protein
MSDRSNGFSWFLAGLGLGALVGVLYAPKSGRETREDILSSAREGSEYLRDRSRQAAEQVSEYADRSRARVNEYVDRGRTQWNSYVNQGRQFVHEQTDKVTAAVEAGKHAYQTAASGNAGSFHEVETPEGQA